MSNNTSTPSTENGSGSTPSLLQRSSSPTPVSNNSNENAQGNNSTTTTTTTTAAAATTTTLGVLQPTTPESLSEAWKAYNINRRKGLLDKQATELADRRENSSASRKRLIKETSEYRKLPASDPGKVGKAGALLKLYQEEIDSITKRCKAAETAFTDAYRHLIEVPDVSLAVSAMLDERARGHRAAEAELENKQLRDELDAFRKEFAELKNQQVTIRRLEAQAKELQREAADAHQGAAEQRAAADEERRRSARLEEALAEREAFVQQLQGEAARALKASQDSQATLLGMRSSFEGQVSALRSEVELLSAELEKKKTSAEAATAAAAGAAGTMGGAAESSPANELRVAQQEIEIARLEHSLAEITESAAAEKRALDERVAQLEGLLASARAEKEALEHAKPSPEEYARVLRDYETLRTLIDGDADAGAQAQTPSGSVTPAPEDQQQQQQGSVEQMLYGKARRLEAENARLRTRVDEVETLSAQQKEALGLLTEENSKMRTLVERLEDQLSQNTLAETSDAHARSHADAFLDTAAVTGTAGSSQQGGGNSGVGSGVGVVEPPQAGSATAVLEIVCSQRDRFRDRIAELEAEKSQLMDSLERAENAANTLRADNVKLYERVKFLQSYGGGSGSNGNGSNGIGSGSGSGSGIIGNRRVTGGGAGNDDIEARYGKMYEDAANPFMEFSKRERMRKIREMNATDRFLFNTTRVMMSNKYIRMGFFVYMVLLHLVVFLSLYKMAWSATDAPPFVEGQTL